MWWKGAGHVGRLSENATRQMVCGCSIVARSMVAQDATRRLAAMAGPDTTETQPRSPVLGTPTVGRPNPAASGCSVHSWHEATGDRNAWSALASSFAARVLRRATSTNLPHTRGGCLSEISRQRPGARSPTYRRISPHCSRWGRGPSALRTGPTACGQRSVPWKSRRVKWSSRRGTACPAALKLLFNP